MSDIQIINPITFQDWNKLLLTADNPSFFHTSQWASVLSESYNYEPLYFSVIEKGKLTALLPVMGINSILTGKRGVSLPFTDECPPIARDSEQFHEIFNKVIQHGKKEGWKHIELRGGDQYFPDNNPSNSFLTHDLDLSCSEKELFNSFRSSTKRNIKKAIKENVIVSIFDSIDAVKSFFRLNCITRKDHGLPPQPYSFFKNMARHVMAARNGIVVLASHSNKIIAGAVYFFFGEKAMYKYGASDKTYQNLRANNLVMWEAIRWLAEKGYKSLSFGRTEPGHHGLNQFKTGWGTKKGILNYYKYDLKRDSIVTEPTQIKSSYNIFNKMPLPLLKLTGRILYRHVG
ncbi:MAG: peptidoglycan bridge formation glycyltransferase FemA/FemB family protein [Bacteroidetes bacterium]|nr:peptidoglycan bridge formation glycyltransferase FemA/FemB family protein [Bacteroidota bacterium]